MPVEQSLWRITDDVIEIPPVSLESERKLEDIIEKKIEVLNTDWLIIGRQVATAYNNYIDLLAIDNEGNLIVIELKKHRTPRDVVAQAIDYATWVQNLDAAQIANIFEKYAENYLHIDINFDNYFQNKYGFIPEDVEINQKHQMIIVAAEIDSSTERIVSYLSDSEIPINVIFFKVFQDNGAKYISRAWLIDPIVTSSMEKVSSRNTVPWNGEFYISYGTDDTRSWKDAVAYGFISGGGKPWYSRTLNLLKPGDRVWVNIPKTGFVGVGLVKETAMIAKECKIYDDKSIFELEHSGSYHEQFIDDDDRAEYIVKVQWLHTVPEDDAVKEIGFFGNQNTVARPRVPKWDHTINRLKDVWSDYINDR